MYACTGQGECIEGGVSLCHWPISPYEPLFVRNDRSPLYNIYYGTERTSIVCGAGYLGAS